MEVQSGNRSSSGNRSCSKQNTSGISGGIQNRELLHSNHPGRPSSFTAPPGSAPKGTPALLMCQLHAQRLAIGPNSASHVVSAACPRRAKVVLPAVHRHLGVVACGMQPVQDDADQRHADCKANAQRQTDLLKRCHSHRGSDSQPLCPKKRINEYVSPHRLDRTAANSRNILLVLPLVVLLRTDQPPARNAVQSAPRGTTSFKCWHRMRPASSAALILFSFFSPAACAQVIFFWASHQAFRFFHDLHRMTRCDR